MKIRIKGVPRAYNGLQVEDNKFTPISHNMIMLNGDTHEDGGTMVNYHGKTIEAEKGEPISIGDNNEAIIWGNMQVPGTKKKFKSVAKELGETEAKYSKYFDFGAQKMQENQPDEKYGRLGYNTGRIMSIGANMTIQSVAQAKSKLANVQRSMLETADEMGLDPQEMSKGKIKKAKSGLTMMPDGGTVADRHNNPGNIKFGRFAKAHGAVQGEPAPDGGYFAKFPDRTAGFSAMYDLLKTDTYKNKTVTDAIKTWTGGKPYQHNLGELEGKKVSNLTPHELSTMLGVMTQGEGTRYGLPDIQKQLAPPNVQTYVPNPYTFNKKGLPNINLTPDAPPGEPVGATPPPVNPFQIPQDRPIPSNVQALDFRQILPEIGTFATNRVEPVALQKYTPQLYVPYQMSFQDRLNDNQSSFNAQLRQTTGRPDAIGQLGSNKYSADNAVRAEEFRTNQGIQADTINKNVSLNNDAQLKNLQLADTQYVRQAEARSKTRELNNMILSSVSNKYLQNDLNNKRLAAYENLYDYRFNDTNNDNIPDQATYYGPDAYFSYSQGNNSYGSANPYSRTVVERDASGNIKKTRQVTPSQQDIEGKQLLNTQRRKKTPLLDTPKLFE